MLNLKLVSFLTSVKVVGVRDATWLRTTNLDVLTAVLYVCSQEY